MDELVKAISDKTGLSPEQAKGAAQAAVDFLKNKLPAPVAGQLDGILSGNAAGGVADAAKGLGSLFGKK